MAKDGFSVSSIESFMKIYADLYSEMTAFGEADKKRIFDSMTPEDFTILKGAFTVYDKGWKAFTKKDFIQILFREPFVPGNSINPNQFKMEKMFESLTPLLRTTTER